MNKKELESLLIHKQEEIKKLEEGFRKLKEDRDFYCNRTTKLNEELEQIHFMLDSVPNSIPKEVKYGDNSWEVNKLTALTRLAAWFASF